MREYENLIGQRFGKLVVQELMPSNEKGHRRWNCLCDCGKTHIVTTGNLKSGHVTNCGCLKSPDLTGQIFGKLTVIRKANEKRKRGNQLHTLWECRCECGEIVLRTTGSLSDKKERMCQKCLKETAPLAMKEAAGFIGGTQISKIQDMKLTAANTSGTRGVYWHKRNQKWHVRLKFKGKLMYFGSYSNYEDAVKARHRAEEDIYGTFLSENCADDQQFE